MFWLRSPNVIGYLFMMHHFILTKQRHATLILYFLNHNVFESVILLHNSLTWSQFTLLYISEAWKLCILCHPLWKSFVLCQTSRRWFCHGCYWEGLCFFVVYILLFSFSLKLSFFSVLTFLICFQALHEAKQHLTQWGTSSVRMVEEKKKKDSFSVQLILCVCVRVHLRTYMEHSNKAVT